MKIVQHLREQLQRVGISDPAEVKPSKKTALKDAFLNVVAGGFGQVEWLQGFGQRQGPGGFAETYFLQILRNRN